ncbi:hypothetical protein N7G274_006294 [Stereocaulon virgatum]|uniref:Uncharacterized protein n=1 Tax=Stereocaulon virgatum TaxID=373712 RepID=A0ABR4A7F6_9LECA
MASILSYFKKLGFNTLRTVAKPTLRTLEPDQEAFMRRLIYSQDAVVSILQNQMRAQEENKEAEIKRGIDREYGNLSKLQKSVSDGLAGDNDKLRGWLDKEREKSNRSQQAAIKSEDENVVLTAKIRDLEAELDRSEKGRVREHDRLVKENTRAEDMYTREAMRWQMSYTGLEARMQEELKHAKNRRVYEEIRIARAERDNYIAELESQIETLRQGAEKSNRREGSLERQLYDSRKTVLEQSNRLVHVTDEVRKITKKLEKAEKALDEKNTTERLSQSTISSLTTKKGDLEREVSRLIVDNGIDREAYKIRAERWADEIADERVKAEVDRAVELERLRGKSRLDQALKSAVKRMNDDWNTMVEQRRTGWQSNQESLKKAISQIKELRNQCKTANDRAETATTSLNQVQQANEELQNSNKQLLIAHDRLESSLKQLQVAHNKLANELNAAREQVRKLTTNPAPSPSIDTSNRADQKRIKDLVQAVTEYRQLFSEFRTGSATDEWQDALGLILDTREVLEKVKSEVDRDGVTYSELQQIFTGATTSKDEVDLALCFIIEETWPHLRRHLRQAYHTMELVMETIRHSMPGAVTARDREKVLDVLTREWVNNLPENHQMDTDMGDAED